MAGILNQNPYLMQTSPWQVPSTVNDLQAGILQQENGTLGQAPQTLLERVKQGAGDWLGAGSSSGQQPIPDDGKSSIGPSTTKGIADKSHELAYNAMTAMGISPEKAKIHAEELSSLLDLTGIPAIQDLALGAINSAAKGNLGAAAGQAGLAALTVVPGVGGQVARAVKKLVPVVVPLAKLAGTELADAVKLTADAVRKADVVHFGIAGTKDEKAAAIAEIEKHFPSVQVKGGTAIASKTVPAIERMTNVPSLRGLPVDEAIKIARKEPHLIQSGGGSEGFYVGGPRDFQSRADLLRNRREVDAANAENPGGGDWYDRTRTSINEVTGGNPLDNQWMSAQEGQYSAGVSPGGELGFALKDNNSALAYGLPVKPARPAQQEASIQAIEANDPTLFQLGKKTGKYAHEINPSANNGGGATGVNDFRHARTLGFTETSGEPQKNAIGAASHIYSDYETALMVDRANKANLGGRSNWTGEQIQAVPWVNQKASDLYKRGSKSYLKKAQQQLLDEKSNMAPDAIEERAKKLAFEDANKTIGDFFEKHTAQATYESRPGVMTGHLPGSVNATPEQLAKFAADPESTWAIAPGGRDGLYAGMRLGDTGISMRVRPTQEAQGLYTPPGGTAEFNPAEVAKPLISFDSGKVKSIPAAERSIMDLNEATRAFIDAQGAGSYHKAWVGGQPGLSTSMVAMKSKQESLSPSQMSGLKSIAEKFGYSDVVDTGEGLTITSFGGTPPRLSSKDKTSMMRQVSDVVKIKSWSPAKVDSGYQGFEDKWTQGVGSGAATRHLLSVIDTSPAALVRAADNNPYTPIKALGNIARDDRWMADWGATREDITNARKIIGDGTGWIGRLRSALESGAVLPAVAAAIFSAAGLGASTSPDAGGNLTQ